MKFESIDLSIRFQFGILCDENEYKLALVGTINNIGGFLFMPLTGVLSDKWAKFQAIYSINKLKDWFFSTHKYSLQIWAFNDIDFYHGWMRHMRFN